MRDRLHHTAQATIPEWSGVLRRNSRLMISLAGVVPVNRLKGICYDIVCNPYSTCSPIVTSGPEVNAGEDPRVRYFIEC